GSSMRRDISPAEEADRLQRLQDAHGYQAFKIRIGKNFGSDTDVYPGRTEEIVPAVRRAIGDRTDLYVDANSGFTPARAIEVGHMLEQYGVCHYEEPCPYPQLEWTKQVADALELPVTGGEQDTDLAQFQRMISMHAVDIVQPDICYIGGLSRALKVAQMAEAAGMTCTPHAANLSMVTIFTLHMAAAVPNAGRFVEFSIEPDHWTEGLFTSGLKVEEGKVHVPDGPGWGVTIHPEWLAKAEYRISQI
ncbi:mandelate racemase/muconate lactonizing enzyme family protein, partial [Paenibacillus sepulcri]|nr:mandelate racemase/muconate lactonizing enzyme family protein [Paenibacillus sepulcri]